MKPTCALVSLLLISAVSAQADELRCTFRSRYICSPDRCAAADPSTAFVILRMETGQYGRCDGSPQRCDWYPLTIQQGGLFLNLSFSVGVQGAKMSQDGNLFIETVSVGDAVLVSYGGCQGAL
jgi:hypothetical protein